MTTLYDTLQCGEILLSNRVVMAPLTRMRSKQPGNIPWALNAEYYSQRASAGLIISEASQISQQGQGYPGTPGIFTPEQVAGWKLVTDSVHSSGGKIFLQLWHVGRISHRSHQPGGELPVAPSAIKPAGGIFSADWQAVEFETPRALELSEIPGIIDDYRRGAENAKLAGFDGVEIHSANGYLLDQFLQDGSNKRSDQYGGTVENRMRFLLEVTDAVVKVWGAGRVGVRLSPYGTFNDMSDSDPVTLYTTVLRELSVRKIAYAHLVEPRAVIAAESMENLPDAPSASAIFRDAFNGVLISAGGYSKSDAEKAVLEGRADAIAFGRLFISNPDLPRRLQTGADLNAYDRSSFYGGSEKGYTD
ncbi:MAG: alkene reductase, partial [Bdellovibrionales bacterium]|nr:alkene reductase [Bdellovibrionales bacterium]